MTKYVCFLAFLFIGTALAAQTLTVSEDIPIRSDARYELIGELHEQTLLLRERANVFDVQGFDERMHESWEKEIELDKRAPKLIGTATDNDNFWLFYQFRERGHTILKAHRYDAGANLVDSARVADLGFLFFTPQFEMTLSQNNEKALLYFAEQNRTVRVYSFDMPAMELLFQQSVDPDDFYFSQDFLQLVADNAGGMHLIIQRDNFRSRRKQHYYEVHSFGGYLSGGEYAYNVSMQDNLTYDVYFNYDNLHQRLVAAGLYSDKDLNRATGYFFMRVDPAASADFLLRFQSFDAEFATNLTGKPTKKYKGIGEASVRQTIFRQDGGILMVAERNRQLERRSGASSRVFYDSGVRLMVDYYYEELFVVSIHPDGEMHWNTILHKKQYSQDDEGVYSSFFLMETPEKLHFLFNDEVSYENTVSEYVLNGLGNFDRHSIFSTENMELRLRFRDAIQVDVNELIIPSERRNRLKLVKLEF